MGTVAPPLAERPPRGDVPRSRGNRIWPGEARQSGENGPRAGQMSAIWRLLLLSCPTSFLAATDRHAGHLLEDLDDRRAVLFVEPGGAGHLIDLLRQVGEQQRHAEPFG